MRRDHLWACCLEDEGDEKMRQVSDACSLGAILSVLGRLSLADFPLAEAIREGAAGFLSTQSGPEYRQKGEVTEVFRISWCTFPASNMNNSTAWVPGIPTSSSATVSHAGWGFALRL